jgi:hypothetical protein
MFFSCLGASMLGRGSVLVLVCTSLLCAHARSEFEGILCRGVLGTLTGRALGHCGNVPVAVCRMSVGNGRGPVNRCTLNIDTWDYSHAPL